MAEEQVKGKSAGNTDNDPHIKRSLDYSEPDPFALYDFIHCNTDLKPGPGCIKWPSPSLSNDGLS